MSLLPSKNYEVSSFLSHTHSHFRVITILFSLCQGAVLVFVKRYNLSTSNLNDSSQDERINMNVNMMHVCCKKKRKRTTLATENHALALISSALTCLSFQLHFLLTETARPFLLF